MAADVRKKMIEGTMSLLARHGLHGTSFSAILAETGAPRGSLYHHFPTGKDELVAAAVDEAGKVLRDALAVASGQPAKAVVERFLAIWRTVLTRGECDAGCAVLAVTIEGAPPELRARAANIFLSWCALLSDLLTRGGLPRKQAETFAVTLIAAVEGAVALSRAAGHAKPFETVAAQLLGLVHTMTREQ